MSEKQQPSALPTTGRIESLDALRGVAVLGIFVMNIMYFGLGESLMGNPVQAGGDTAIDNGLWSFAEVFVSGTMRGLFSLMFGAGVILFTMRAIEPDAIARNRDLYYRRNLWLIPIGLFHSYVFLGPGDILLIYGIAGLILFPFRKLTPRTLIVLGAVTMAVLVALISLDEFAEHELYVAASEIEAKLDRGETVTADEEILLYDWKTIERGNFYDDVDLKVEKWSRSSSVGELFRSNTEIVTLYTNFWDVSWWVADAIAMMFIGMALFKLGVLTNERSLGFYVKLAVIGYGIGLGLRSLWMVERWASDFSTALWAWSVFGQPVKLALTLGHVGLFFCLWKAFEGSAVMRALTATGRMALTNYLSQTIFANLMFSAIGLGLYMQLRLSGVYLIMIGIWLFQIGFSVWWLSRHRFGPFEWVWRGLTYGKLPPNRL